MNVHTGPAPDIDAARAVAIVESLYGLRGDAERLPSGDGAVFMLVADTARAILKITAGEADFGWLETENRIVDRVAAALPEHRFPRARPSLAGRTVESWDDEAGARHGVRLLDWVPGVPLVRADTVGARTLRGIGRMLGRIDRALASAHEPAAERRHDWDIRDAAAVVERNAAAIDDPRRQALALRIARDAAARVAAVSAGLRTGVIHGDANDYNVFVEMPLDDGERAMDEVTSTDVTVRGHARVAGLIDFGDASDTWLVAEPAIAAAYAMLDRAAPLVAAAALLEGYDAEYTLDDAEHTAFYPLILLRLCASVSLSAQARVRVTSNAYLGVSEAPAWALLERLASLDPDAVEAELREAVGASSAPGVTVPRLDHEIAAPAGTCADAGELHIRAGTAATGSAAASAASILRARHRSIGPSLRLSYSRPLHIVRGWMQHLYDAGGRRYLDCVNNVAHVGHSHPHVVEAIARQAALLNTNTRYLYANLVAYAERLAAMLPEPLSVCYFVNSGSEANELALRLARAHTGSRNVIVVEGAYHGNTSAMIELSPYKFDGPGGGGKPPHVWTTPTPDPYRGRHRRASAPAGAPAGVAGGKSADTEIGFSAGAHESAAAADASLGSSYAGHVDAAAEAAAAADGGLAAFFVEPLLSCAGQIVPPTGYLAESFAHVRARGGVCVADEVQVGFGRVGRGFWGFELGGVVPDIVTMGKPIGNGHPIGAVVTTPQIAASFDDGMEYFNTFGGNPVSCAAGIAVLEVVDEEDLQSHAREVGDVLQQRLRAMMPTHRCIGDVRGSGLFLGIEFVVNPDVRSPAPRLADYVVERMRERGILLSTDGPAHNVIKIKPPLPFDVDDAERLAGELGDVLETAPMGLDS